MREVYALMRMTRKIRVYGFRGRLLAFAAMVPLLAAFAAGQWWMDRWSLGVTFDAYFSAPRVMANAAAGFAAFLLLAAVTRRLLLPLLLVAGAHALLYVASAIKYKLLGMPVMLQDLYFLTSLDASSLHLFSNYVDLTWPMVLAGLGVPALLLALFWLEPRWCRALAWSRLAVGTTSALLLAGLCVATWPWTDGMYAKAAIRPSPLSAMPAVLHSGLVSSLVYYNGQQRHRRLEVDDAALRGVLARLQENEATRASVDARAAAVQPDVVIVLSESFMDPRVLKGMQALPDVIPNMRAALQARHGGMMQAPTFGGGTVRTEFEVLTGMPVEAFQDVHYPYVDLNVSSMPGVVGDLKKRGYASFALHGNAGSFWNRTSTYKAMGIDRFITQRDMMKAGAVRDGGWVADRSMTDILLAELGRATQPTVAVAISIEAHGPYDSQPEVRDGAAREAIRIPAGLNAEAAAEFRNYLYHLHNADRELGRLLEGLHARGRPFVLLFFGDHLPAFNGVYEQLEFADGRDARQQYVPWLLASENDGMTTPSFAYAWELPALLMQTVAADDDGWFGFVRRVGEQMGPDASDEDRGVFSRGLKAGANARLSGRFDDYLKR